jgi:DNA primase
LHDDQHKSFSIYKNAKDEWRCKCFAGCVEGDEIDFLERLENLPKAEAIKRYLELAGENGPSRSQVTHSEKPKP